MPYKDIVKRLEYTRRIHAKLYRERGPEIRESAQITRARARTRNRHYVEMIRASLRCGACCNQRLPEEMVYVKDGKSQERTLTLLLHKPCTMTILAKFVEELDLVCSDCLTKLRTTDHSPSSEETP